MSETISLVRAAKLVGVPRSVLQKKVRDGELASFDGFISVESLLSCYPEAHLDEDAVLKRVMQIKERAFGKRVFERALPDAEVLAARLSEAGKKLARSQTQLEGFQRLLRTLWEKLDALEQRAGSEGPQPWAELKAWVKQETDTAMEPGYTNPLAIKNEVLAIMTAQVTISPGKQEFLVEGQDTLLESAMKAGIPLNYGCSGGNCGLCRAKVVSGEAKKTKHHDFIIPEADKYQGYVLLCCNTAVGDMTIEAEVAGSAQDIPLQQINAKVKAIAPLTDDVMLLHLETPRSQRLRFLAGQGVKLRVSAAYDAELPIASCPCDDRNVLFHVHRQSGNLFADYVFDSLKRNDIVEIEGPQGEFILHEGLPRKLYFFAFDGGFAPVKSLIEHALSLNAAAIQLHWFGSGQHSIYLPNVARAWNDALDNLGYAEHVTGFDLRSMNDRRVETLVSYLRDMVEKDRELLEGNIYIAGPEMAVRLAEQLFIEMGVPGTRVTAGII